VAAVGDFLDFLEVRAVRECEEFLLLRKSACVSAVSA
jgi:hypothetical protein